MRGTTHLDDRVEAGDGWLPSEAPLLGELWSLSPLLPQVCSGASSLNSCPDMIRSISSSVIYIDTNRMSFLFLQLSLQHIFIWPKALCESRFNWLAVTSSELPLTKMLRSKDTVIQWKRELQRGRKEANRCAERVCMCIWLTATHTHTHT